MQGVKKKRYTFDISNQSNPGTQPPCPPSLGKRRGEKARCLVFSISLLLPGEGLGLRFLHD
jgi:hypothetical protein